MYTIEIIAFNLFSVVVVLIIYWLRQKQKVIQIQRQIINASNEIIASLRKQNDLHLEMYSISSKSRESLYKKLQDISNVKFKRIVAEKVFTRREYENNFHLKTINQVLAHGIVQMVDFEIEEVVDQPSEIQEMDRLVKVIGHLNFVADKDLNTINTNYEKKQST